MRFPRWLDDNTVMAIVQEIRTADGVSQVVYTLQRFDISSGERERVLDDVLQFDISPDGERIVYAKLGIGVGETLEIVDVDGSSNARTLVPVEELIAPFNTPRFSPDGTQIAFAAADQTMAPVIPTVPSGVRPVSYSAAKLLDGLPQDIWLVSADDTGRPQQVADLKEDLPSLTWDASGEHIFVLGIQGLHDVNLRNGAVTNLGPGVFHAQVAWAHEPQ